MGVVGIYIVKFQGDSASLYYSIGGSERGRKCLVQLEISHLHMSGKETEKAMLFHLRMSVFFLFVFFFKFQVFYFLCVCSSIKKQMWYDFSRGFSLMFLNNGHL